jgi:hypothetical protein
MSDFLARIVNYSVRTSPAATEVDIGAPSTGSGWRLVDIKPFADSAGPGLIGIFDKSVPLSEQQEQINLPPTADATVTERVFATNTRTLSKIAVWALTPPVSTLGTVLLTFKKNGGNTVLGAANFNAETLVAETWTTMTLTGTAADLAFVEGDYVECKIVSNNADMTGAAFVKIAVVF